MEGLDQAIQSLLHDQQLVAVFGLVGLDILLGVLAAIYPKAQTAGKFHFEKLTAFLYDDVLGKVLPWAAIYIFAQMYPSMDVLGVNLGDIATGIFVGVVAALVASLTVTLGDFGLPVSSIPVIGGALSRPVPESTGGAVGETP